MSKWVCAVGGSLARGEAGGNLARGLPQNCRLGERGNKRTMTDADLFCDEAVSYFARKARRPFSSSSGGTSFGWKARACL